MQQELFPLCVMLYPPLKVGWELLDKSLQSRLTPASYAVWLPYLKAVQGMFSLEVFPENDPIWSYHPDVVRFLEPARQLLQELLNQKAG